MAFEVRCPNCNKLYAAEWRLVGKRIRCRGCQHVFQIGAPTDAPVPAVAAAAEGEGDGVSDFSAGPSLGPDASHVGASDLHKTREGVVVPPSENGTAYEEAGATPSPMMRPSVPQQFPMSDVVEAWLPLALGLISAVWVISQTFGANQTGRAWVALMRIGIVAAFYLGLIVPITYQVIKSNFRKLKRVLPPSPMQRTAFTFALPLALGYVFWLVSSGGMSSLITGLLLGVVLMAAVYWLLFRLDPQEAAQSYMLAAATFLACVVVCGLILVGVGMWVNKAMVATDAARSFTENPLASPLAWVVPPPAPPKAIIHQPQNNEPAVVENKTAEQPKSTPKTANEDKVAQGPQADGQSESHSTEQTAKLVPPKLEVADNTPPDSTTPGATATDTSGKNATDKSRLFDLSPDADPVLAKLRGLPWVKDASCPSDEGTYDATISPLTPSPYIGFLKASAGSLEICQLTPEFAKTPRILIPNAQKPAQLAHSLALAPDASAVLRLMPGTGVTAIVQVIPVNPGSVRIMPSIMISPNGMARGGVLSAEDAMLQPELLGALPDNRFLVRWSAPGRQVIQVYAYTRPKPLLTQFNLPGTSDLFAVDPAGTWIASVTTSGRAKSVRLDNLRNASLPPRTCLVHADAAEFARGADVTSIAFAPNPDVKRVAALYEKNGKAIVQSWSVETQVAGKMSKTLDVPQSDGSSDHPQPRPLAWVGNGWLVYGRTMVNNFTGEPVGTFSEGVIDGVQVANTKAGFAAYVTYVAPDGHDHTAAVTVDPAALKPTTGSAGNGSISVGG